MGNLQSVRKAFVQVGAEVVISNDIEDIKSADKIVLPGVGSFKDGMRNLDKLGLVNTLNQEVQNNKKPFLGICLGMQLIANRSYENGKTDGLGWVDAEVIRFEFEKENKLKVPHVGWNNVSYKNGNRLFTNISDNSDFYFVHSFYFKENEDAVTSSTEYGFEFTSSIKKENIYAVQFHPEKSQSVGLKLIENFVSSFTPLKAISTPFPERLMTSSG